MVCTGSWGACSLCTYVCTFTQALKCVDVCVGSTELIYRSLSVVPWDASQMPKLCTSVGSIHCKMFIDCTNKCLSRKNTSGCCGEHRSLIELCV